jgi:hypothetical protein
MRFSQKVLVATLRSESSPVSEIITSTSDVAAKNESLVMLTPTRCTSSTLRRKPSSPASALRTTIIAKERVNSRRIICMRKI